MNFSSLRRTTVHYFVISVFLYFATALSLNKTKLKEQAFEMFQHAYWSYMKNAYPADELMPLSCQGRRRHVTPSRGDIDDALGNFSLTLIDALDTLVVIGDYEEFARAVNLVVENVKFDSDLVVSVFETNIRIVGGLLSGHLLAKILKNEIDHYLMWYDDHLLNMAREVADRLLPAFETQTGVPYPRVNLKHGLDGPAYYLRSQQDTCTACAGTMILEFATLSRLTGESIYEAKAKKAMDFLWAQRHSVSDLMGTVLNVHNGDWVRRDSGVGAGIDSYYEYCFKAYVLLGDEEYLHRFNKHYSAVMKHVSQGPLMVDVLMHSPSVSSRSFMDSLLAFWPGLQVLKGDLKPAIEMHEMLYQVIQKHNFLPEAFTHDFQVHWGQYPLRPEFVESTYFLYKATKDEYYLKIGEGILDSLNRHVRVDCGFAGIKDLRTMVHEDRMDSFVLAETFKYLYLLFAEKSDLIFDIDQYIFTTEAHFLPLSVSSFSSYTNNLKTPVFDDSSNDQRIERRSDSRTCPNSHYSFYGTNRGSYASLIRERLRNFVRKASDNSEMKEDRAKYSVKLAPVDFNPSNPDHVYRLKRMGISLITQSDGKMQLVHSSSQAFTSTLAEEGLQFMQDMVKELGSQAEITQNVSVSRVVQLISPPFFGTVDELASPAQFGQSLEDEGEEIIGRLLLADPIRGCAELQNEKSIDQNTIVIMERSDCMFIEKVRRAQNAGAGGVIIFDHSPDTDFNATSPSFAMSGDGSVDVFIPSVFLYRKQGERLLDLMSKDAENTVYVRIGAAAKNPRSILKTWLTNNFIADSKRKLGAKLWSPQRQSLLAAPDGRKKKKVINGHVNIFSSPLSSSYSALNLFENLLKSVARNQDENNDNLDVLLSKKQTISRFASTLDKILKDPTLLQLFNKSNFKLKTDQSKDEADDDINEFLNILEEKLDEQRDLKP